MVRRTKEEAQETRTRILDAAEQVFSEKGVSRTSLADPTETTAIAPRTWLIDAMVRP